MTQTATVDRQSSRTATWVLIPDAAALLGVSTRTIERRIAGGQLERQERDGRVFVGIPDDLRAPADRMIEAVQADALQLRAMAASITSTAEQTLSVMQSALARADAATVMAEARTVSAEARSRRAGWLAGGLAVLVGGLVAVAVSVSMDAARSREEARQLTAAVSEAETRATAATARADALEAFTAVVFGGDTLGH